MKTLKIKYNLNTEGYIESFATVGDLPNQKEIEIEDFDEFNFECYKEVDGQLVFDEQKLQEKLSPPPVEHKPALEEQIVTLRAEKDVLAKTLDMVLVDILPTLMPE